MGNFFSPLAGRFGIMPNLLAGRCDAAIGNNTTTTYSFGGHPAKCVINRAVVSAGTVPASTSGTILAVLQKYDASANTAVTLTDAEKLLDTGDTLQFVVTTNNTVTTAAVDLMVNIELLVQN